MIHFFNNDIADDRDDDIVDGRGHDAWIHGADDGDDGADCTAVYTEGYNLCCMLVAMALEMVEFPDMAELLLAPHNMGMKNRMDTFRFLSFSRYLLNKFLVPRF